MACKIVGKSHKPVGCDVCIQGKMTNDRSKRPRVKSKIPLEVVHTDLAGPITSASILKGSNMHCILLMTTQELVLSTF